MGDLPLDGTGAQRTGGPLMASSVLPSPITARAMCEWFRDQIAGRESNPLICVESWILGYGQGFKYRDRPAEVERDIPKECFRNALLLAMSRPDLNYAEGFVLSTDLPILIHHAWCVDLAGLVVEPTLPRTDEDGECTPENTTYFGVVLDNIGEILDVIRGTRTYGLLYKEEGHALIEARCGKTTEVKDGQA